ncbi:stress response protein nst1 [Acrasis kona]|uniref:Stress response protein nst1 n=1 Tax=Acrasis kona TaxID=1008807 RepID=A0AAW2ZPX1_9EUKA
MTMKYLLLVFVVFAFIVAINSEQNVEKEIAKIPSASKNTHELQKVYKSLNAIQKDLRKRLHHINVHLSKLKKAYQDSKVAAQQKKKEYEVALKEASETSVNEKQASKNKAALARAQKKFEKAKKKQSEAFVNLNIAKKAAEESRTAAKQYIKQVKETKNVVKN